MFPSGLTILGTDTEVGKTYVACRIIESLVQDGVKVGAYKPVASGAPTRSQSDGFQLWQASNQLGTLEEVNPQCFLAPLAPPVAAELEGKQVSDDLILEGAKHWYGKCEMLVAEGAGGLLSPISWNMTNATFAKELGFPIVLVSENKLGVVNQVLTAVTAARSLGLTISVIVLNERIESADIASTTNLRLLKWFLEKDSEHPMVAVLRRNERDFEPKIQWQGVERLSLNRSESSSRNVTHAHFTEH